MVSETEYPDPRCVAREFITQYYTILHEAPEKAHRFYCSNSSFKFGEVEESGEEETPAVGQNEIHRKIMSLDFKGCNFKVRRVDSQMTLGKSIVIQVAGELSKNHEHMRMFMQTFVLEPQTPKKYYVRTAIFKYQDSVHDDNKQAAKSVAEDKKVSDKQPTADGTAPVKEEDSIQFGGPAFLLKRSLGLKEGKKPKWQVCKQVRLINIAPAKKVSDEQPRAEGTEPEKEEKPLRLGAPADEPQQSEVSQKSDSWAEIMNEQDGQEATAMLASQMAANQSQSQRSEVQPQGERRDNTPSIANNVTKPTNQQPRKGGPPRNMFPDKQQIFVGCLPKSVEENQLKELFQKFGKVEEVRVNRRNNYGFVAFQSPETVTKVLQQRPIMLGKDIRLNVEEKNQRGKQGGRLCSGINGRGGDQGKMGGQGGKGGRRPRGSGNHGDVKGPARGAGNRVFAERR